MQELPEYLGEVRLNTITGELVVNGIPMKNVDEFSLNFSQGEWELTVRRTQHYSVREQYL